MISLAGMRAAAVPAIVMAGIIRSPSHKGVVSMTIAVFWEMTEAVRQTAAQAQIQPDAEPARRRSACSQRIIFVISPPPAPRALRRANSRILLFPLQYMMRRVMRRESMRRKEIRIFQNSLLCPTVW